MMRAIGQHSRCSDEYELDEHGNRTGRKRPRQFAIAWDETDQRRGAFAGAEEESRGPSMYPKMEKFR